MDGNRVTGAIVEQKRKRVTIKTTRGVLLSAGGFEHNLPMRQKYNSPTITTDISLGSAGNTGNSYSLLAGLDLQKALMEEVWWFVGLAPLSDKESPQILLAERSVPGCIIVNEKGERFINEAIDYMSFGQIIRKKEKEGNPIKEMWLVFDQQYKNSYIMAGSVFPRMPLPNEWYDAGIADDAENAESLATKLNINPENLSHTMQHFNKMAATGKDADFHKGESAYDRYYGDPTIKPNPNIRPLSGKLYAVKLVLTDLGTCGGFMTDENGRLLKNDGQPVQGLYGAGNVTANVFGRCYPGAGATIGAGLVYSYISAMHAAKQKPLEF